MTERATERIPDRVTGPVVITGADGHVGRRLQRRLASRPNPIRPLTQIDIWSTAMRDAAAVIHLAGTLQPKYPNTYWRANVGTVERYLDALVDSSVQRIVFLSYVGADPNSENEYLRTKGTAEQLIRDAGIPNVIVRSTFVYGELDDIGPSFSSYQANPGGRVSVLGTGAQLVAPIHVDDLASLLIAAALDPSTPTGTFDVSGLDTFTLDQFATAVNPAGVRIRHLPSPLARLLARFMRDLTPALVDVLLSESVASVDPANTAEAFGISLRHFDRTIAHSTSVRGSNDTGEAG